MPKNTKSPTKQPSLQYPLRFDSPREWADSTLPWEIKCGPSPGGVAVDLGVSRQTVYNWISLGYLHQVYVGPNPPAVYITTQSVNRLQAVLEQLRLEWNVQCLKGSNVASALAERLPQLDLFRDHPK